MLVAHAQCDFRPVAFPSKYLLLLHFPIVYKALEPYSASTKRAAAAYSACYSPNCSGFHASSKQQWTYMIDLPVHRTYVMTHSGTIPKVGHLTPWIGKPRHVSPLGMLYSTILPSAGTCVHLARCFRLPAHMRGQLLSSPTRPQHFYQHPNRSRGCLQVLVEAPQ